MKSVGSCPAPLWITSQQTAGSTLPLISDPSSQQLINSEAQSLMLLTTVAMPVFSKKNETVSGYSPCCNMEVGAQTTELHSQVQGLHADSQASLWATCALEAT